MRIFLALLIAPLIEIAVFIAVGREIGILSTIALTLITAIIGSLLLRYQGLKALREIQADMAQDRIPARPLVDGAMISVAGLFLLTPGFVSDILGFCLFIPPVRDMIWRNLSKHFSVSMHASTATYRPDEDVVDLDSSDYADVEKPIKGQLSDNSDSPWREPKKP